MKIAEIITEGEVSRGDWVKRTIMRVFNEDEYDELKQFMMQNYNHLKIGIEKYMEGNVIYRGMRSKTHNSCFYMDPTNAGERIAANTENYMNTIISNLPSWQAYPPRNKSFICSGQRSTASGYGDEYFMIPFGDPPIGNAGTGDFWDVYKSGVYVDSINTVIQNLGNFVKAEAIKNQDGNEKLIRFNKFTQLVKIFQLAAMYIQEKQVSFAGHSSINMYYKAPMITHIDNALRKIDYKSHKQVIGVLDQLFGVQQTNATVTPLSNYRSTDNEVWFSAPAIAVHYHWDHIFEDLVVTMN